MEQDILEEERRTHRRALRGFKMIGGLRVVRIRARDDSCEICREISKRSYPIDEVPELPIKECTSERGCQCCYDVVRGDENTEGEPSPLKKVGGCLPFLLFVMISLSTILLSIF